MSDEEKRGFVFHSSQGETELSIEEVKQLAEQSDPDGLYALGMAYLYGWDIAMFYTVVRRCWAVSSIDTVRKELHPWTSSSGEIRYYVNDWFDLIGDALESFV